MKDFFKKQESKYAVCTLSACRCLPPSCLFFLQGIEAVCCPMCLRNKPEVIVNMLTVTHGQ